MQEFKVRKNKDLGRYAVAAKTLKAGEIFLKETPFAYGPKLSSGIVCLECCMPTKQRCTKCGWPLCEHCAPKKVVHKEECEIFVRTNTKFYNQLDQHNACIQLDCITPLRVLLAKEKDEERWNQEVDCMEDHETERKEKSTWIIDENNIVQYLRKQMKLVKYSAELIRHVIGILEVNAFEGRSVTGYEIKILYPKLAILAHNCVPNTAHTIYSQDEYRMVARTTVDVKEGADLYSTYTYTSYCTFTRQNHLRQGKFFTCKCKRCLDPTELNTHLSSFKCLKCDNGTILSTAPLDENAQWKCTCCEFSTSGNNVQKTLNVMQNEIDNILQMDYTAERLEALETLFKKYHSVLHSQHYIMMTLRQYLIESYGQVPGYKMSNLPDTLLERKIELCESVLKTLNLIEPQLTRSRGAILYDLYVPKLMLAQSMYQHGVIDGITLKKNLEDALKILEESYNILSLEDSKTVEGILATKAKSGIEQLKKSILSINESNKN